MNQRIRLCRRMLLCDHESPDSSLTLAGRGFTIIELLVVIVIIAILAAITTISYTGITSRATTASLQSDLSNNRNTLKMYAVQYGSYPTSLDGSNCPSAPTADTNFCLKSSGDNILNYQPSSTSRAADFTLYANKNSVHYRISSDSSISSAVTRVCPYGFIIVPGSSIYGTSDFCVMKYEAKADDDGDGVGDTSQTSGYNTWPANSYPVSASRKLVSTAAGYPVANISQVTANTAATNYTAGCSSGCHIITEAEWMTIAQNVLSVASNWSGGSVGSGYIYYGHNNNSPSNALVADANDSNGYYGETNTGGGTQRRTLTLTNGEVIWDLAGNLWEWTAGQTTGGQPGITGESSYAWKEWTAASASGSLAVNPFPSGTGLSGASGWNSSNGVGKLYSNAGETLSRSFIRSGHWGNGTIDGVLALQFTQSTYTDWIIGLRVTKP